MTAGAKLATYDDLLALGDDVRAEVVHGSLHTSPAPLPRHARVQRALGRFLGGPFDDDDGRGWWILLEVRTDASGTRNFVHDVTGHLRRTVLGSNSVDYDYDPAGRLIAIRPSGPSNTKPEQYFIYRDGLNPVGWRRTTLNASMCATGFDQAYFIYGSSRHTPDMMIYDFCADGVLTNTAAGDGVYSIHSDERGSVRLVVRISDGKVVLREDYGAWGVLTVSLSSVPIPFGFAGGIWLQDANLWHFGARDMDPAIVGRWTTRDPIYFAGGENLYAYAGNDPVNQVDPTGLLVRACSRSGQGGQTNIYLDFPIAFAGFGDRARVLDEINRTWSGMFGRYAVRMHAYEVSEGPANFVEFIDGVTVPSPEGPVAGWTSNGGATRESSIYLANQFVDGPAAAHEAGHAMGVGPPNHSIEPGNLMLEAPGLEDTGITEAQIDDILSDDGVAGCGGC